MERPNFITETHLGILQNLDESVCRNMFRAVPYLLERCPELNPKQAQETLLYWFKTAEAPAGQGVLVTQ